MACKGCEERRKKIAEYMEAFKVWAQNPLKGPMPTPPVDNNKNDAEDSKVT